MIHQLEDWRDRGRDEIGAITMEINVRVLNCGSTGCLVESSRPLAVASVATLRLRFAGGGFEDIVQIVRCQDITGTGVYHVGAEFLTTAPPSVHSLRYLIRRESGQINAGRTEKQR
jgi:hypothetical protein